MDIKELLSGVAHDREPDCDIQPGCHVRSFDFAGRADCYADGTVEAITEPIEGCSRYRIRVTRRVLNGREVETSEEFVLPPVNGTESWLGGKTNLVVKLQRDD